MEIWTKFWMKLVIMEFGWTKNDILDNIFLVSLVMYFSVKLFQ